MALAVSKIALLLLTFILIGWLGNLYLKTARNWPTYKTSFLASIVAIYSALVEDRVTIAYCFDWWKTALPKRKKVYLPIDLRPSLSSAQSEFVYCDKLKTMPSM